ncbi:DUF1272 domain-containing protein [Shouchella lonarensis]|uniref:DUF1272 domain-containing protein n=1 Tax=Shouchella lonarensis TaxID=1464122 RepID=UPI000B83A4C1|nr:DUF1272 domain-containing protein [Shouchella lonarensis]
MALIMKNACESCTKTLAPHEVAYICIHECTFCPACTKEMTFVCPNCSGELVKRPCGIDAQSNCSL